VFFSSHILTDVEAIADHIAIVARGQLQSQGAPSDLIQRTVLGIDVIVRIAADAEVGTLTDGASRIRRTADELSLTLATDTDVDAWLSAARDKGAKVVAVTPRHETLEDLFMRQVASADSSPAAQEGRV
jgi:ABC-2 type transport system ATP-binding protein